MPLRDILKKKDKLAEQETSSSDNPVPEFTFLRTDTHTQEIINPPSFDDSTERPSSSGHRFSLFKKPRSRASSGASSTSHVSNNSDRIKSKDRSPSSRRLSQRLGLHRDISSSNVPEDLPAIEGGGDGGAEDEWEQRATILARENEKNRSRPATPDATTSRDFGAVRKGDVVATQLVDDNIQEAIRLHEAGQLEEATSMFGRLADPGGENNSLSQVLYGLALR